MDFNAIVMKSAHRCWDCGTELNSNIADIARDRNRDAHPVIRDVYDGPTGATVRYRYLCESCHKEEMSGKGIRMLIR